MSPRAAHRGPYRAAANRIGSRLAQIRTDNGLTQAQCAAALGISERQYRAIEHGDFVSEKHADILSRRFNCTPEFLLEQFEDGESRAAS